MKNTSEISDGEIMTEIISKSKHMESKTESVEEKRLKLALSLRSL